MARKHTKYTNTQAHNDTNTLTQSGCFFKQKRMASCQNNTGKHFLHCTRWRQAKGIKRTDKADKHITFTWSEVPVYKTKSGTCITYFKWWRHRASMCRGAREAAERDYQLQWALQLGVETGASWIRTFWWEQPSAAGSFSCGIFLWFDSFVLHGNKVSIWREKKRGKKAVLFLLESSV